jgi:hypothetical protein
MWLTALSARHVHRAGRCCSQWHRIGLVAEHDGYRRLPGKPVHRRSWHLDRRAACLTVQDQVFASTAQNVTLYWHFSEDCNVTCTPDGLSVSNGPICVDMVAAAGRRRERVARLRRADGRLGVAGLRRARAQHDGGVAGQCDGRGGPGDGV